MRLRVIGVEEGCLMTSIFSAILNKYYSDYQIRNEIGGRVARIGRGKVGKLRERCYLEESDLVGMIILRWLFWKMDVACTGLIWFRIGTGGGLL